MLHLLLLTGAGLMELQGWLSTICSTPFCGMPQALTRMAQRFQHWCSHSLSCPDIYNVIYVTLKWILGFYIGITFRQLILRFLFFPSTLSNPPADWNSGWSLSSAILSFTSKCTKQFAYIQTEWGYVWVWTSSVIKLQWLLQSESICSFPLQCAKYNLHLFLIHSCGVYYVQGLTLCKSLCTKSQTWRSNFELTKLFWFFEIFNDFVRHLTTPPLVLVIVSSFNYAVKSPHLPKVLFSIEKMKWRHHVECLHLQQKPTDLYIRLSECSRLIVPIPHFETAVPKKSNSLLHNHSSPSKVTQF